MSYAIGTLGNYNESMMYFIANKPIHINTETLTKWLEYPSYAIIL